MCENEKVIFLTKGDKIPQLYKVSSMFVLIIILIGCSKEKPPRPPTISGSSEGYINTPITVTVTTTDPNKDDVAYQFNWGDETATTSWTSFFPSGQNYRRSYTYSAVGTFDVFVRAKDEKGNESEWSTPHRIVITRPPNYAPNTPSTPSGPSSGSTNSSYTFYSSATDPDGDSIAIRFNWGNGVISNWSNYFPSGTTISMSYSYPNQGTYIITAQAKDKWGDTSAWSAPHSITIYYYQWITIMSEDFESGFPGTKWTLYGTPTWDDETYRYYQGSRSGWCAGSTMNPPGPYPPDMDAWMTYGPFSLADANYAYVSFYRWLYSEPRYDFLDVLVSTNGYNFYLEYELSGDYRSWTQQQIDLSDYCGYSQVWIAFLFYGDGSIQYEGAYLDNIELKKYIGPKSFLSNKHKTFSNNIKEQKVPIKIFERNSIHKCEMK